MDSGLVPNELGRSPCSCTTRSSWTAGGDYDLTPDEFRAELKRLWDEHYRPITASDLVNGTINVPMGTTPYVMTFDDGGESQIAFDPDGSIDPDTAVGIMLEFAKGHPGCMSRPQPSTSTAIPSWRGPTGPRS